MAARLSLNQAAIGGAFLATSLQMLDTTITVVALPQIRRSLAIDGAEASWIMTAYLVGTALVLPMSGWLASRFGRKQTMLCCLLGFAVTSAVCGFAHDISTMTVSRFLQGVFGAPLAPLSQTLVADRATDENRPHVMARWLGVNMAVPALGPPVGGLIAGLFDWHWVFLVNVPVCLVAILAIWRGHGDSPAKRGLPMDWLGFGLFSLAALSLQLVLDRGQGAHWFRSLEITIGAMIFVFTSTGYLVLHGKGVVTYLNRHLFEDGNYAFGFALMFFSGAFLYGPMVILPSYMSHFGIPTIMIGLLMAPRGLLTMLLMLGGAKKLARLDMRWPLVVGFATVGLSFWLPTLAGGGKPNALIFASTSMMQGAGFALVFVVAAILPFLTLAPALRAQGSGFNSLSRFIGGAVGVAATQTLLSTFSTGSDVAQAGDAAYAATFWLLLVATLLLSLAIMIMRPGYHRPDQRLVAETR